LLESIAIEADVSIGVLLAAPEPEVSTTAEDSHVPQFDRAELAFFPDSIATPQGGARVTYRRLVDGRLIAELHTTENHSGRLVSVTVEIELSN
jgi:hypothetical protein